jgi:Ran GTPase-activating protein (RanGAP) involved in mRNA processing and transport
MCSVLTSLTLSYNLVNDDRLTRYALRLQHCRRLLLVDFTGNNIFNGGAEALARSLEHQEALHELLLPHNNIGLRGASALLEHSSRCSTLTSLDLSNNLIGSCNTARVHPTLRSFLNLRLRTTHDAPSGFEVILDRAAQATALRRLNLTGNHLTVAEIQDIAKRWVPGRPGLCMVHPQDETVYAL